MTFLSKVGSFNTGTGALTTTVAVTGVGFQPKAIIFWWSKSTTTGSTDGTSGASTALGFGFATGAAARNCVTTQWEDNTATGDNDNRWFNDACIAIMLITGVVDGQLDFTSFDADGFTLTVDNQFATSYHISYLALGGTDITDVACGTTTTPAGTGNTANTTPAFQPNVLFTWASLGTTSGAQKFDGAMGFGAATGSSNQGVSGVNGRNSTPIDAYTYSYGGECLAIPTSFDNTFEARASFTSFDANGFTLNWLENNGGAANTYGWLVIKGGNWIVGNLTTQTDTTTDIVENGFGFQPKFGLFVSSGVAVSTQDVMTDDARLSVGAFDSISSRVAQATTIQHDSNPTIATYSVEHDAVYINLSDVDTVIGLMDIKSVETGGFTCIMDDADPSAAYVWYVSGGLPAGWTNISKIDGIASASISKVDGVAVASISKVNGIAV